MRINLYLSIIIGMFLINLVNATVLVNLTAPADGSTQYSNPVNFVCNASTTSGTLNNLSLYSNFTGTWKINQTISSLSNAQLSTNLVSYWKLDNNDLTDFMGLNNGTNYLSANTSGIISDGRSFAGAGENITLADSPSLRLGTLNFTINLWVKTLQSGGAVISKSYNSGSYGWSIRTTSTGSAGTITWSGESGSATCTSAGGGYNDGNWHMITITRANTTTTGIRMFVDGTYKSTCTGADNYNDNFPLGFGTTVYDSPLSGSLDEIGIWNRTLNSTEVGTLYNSGSASRPMASSSTNQTFSKSISGNNLWNCQACSDDGNCAFATSNFTVSSDSNPPIFSVTSPTNIINYGKAGTNITLNFTATDTNLANCWYDYNNTNTTIVGCLSGLYNATNVTLTTQKNITVWANDTAGNINQTLITWDYNIFENSNSYNSLTTSGALETFDLNLTYYSGFSSISTNLVYNGVSYTMSSSGTGNTKSFTTSLTTPTVTTQTNYTFYYSIILTNSTGAFIFNSSSYNQTVNSFLIDNCSSYTKTLLNFSMVDEETLNKVNGTIEVNVNIYTFGTSTLVNSYNMSFNYLTTNSSAICLQNITQAYTMAYQIRHWVNDSYFKIFRNIQNMTITNSSIPQNLTLYNLKTASGYPFNIIVVGNILSSNGNRGLLVDTQKRYLAQNQFISVESAITDNNGIAIAHLIPSSEVYNFVISYNGQLLGTFNNYQVVCQNVLTGQCSITLNLAQATATLPDFENYGNITQTFLLSNNTLYMTFSSIDGQAHLVNSSLIKADGYGNTTICTTAGYGTSGTLQCPIPAIYQNTTFFVQVYSDNTYTGSKFFSQGSSPDWYGVDIFIELLMLSSLVLLFVGHPITLVLGAIIGFIAPVLLISIGGATLGNVIGAIIFYIIGGIIAIIIIGKKM